MTSLRLSGLLVVFAVASVAGCGGQAEEDEELVIDDEASALVENAESEDDGPADDGCRDGDRDGHKHHHRHWFKILDLLDGTRDKAVTLAALPDGLPDRLVARLTRMDANGDGLVTKKEVKRALRRHRQHDGDD